MNDIDNVNHCQVHLQQLASSDDSEAMALRACNAQVWHFIDHPSFLTLKERSITNHATFALEVQDIIMSVTKSTPRSARGTGSPEQFQRARQSALGDGVLHP